MERYTFYNYRKQKPINPGWYVWRLPHKFLSDIVLVFLAEYRYRGAGFETVLSPEFDYWDGYKLHLPKGSIEWAEHNRSAPKTGEELIDVAGVDNTICPFCKSKPKWGYYGRYVAAGPTDTEYYYLTCCQWVDKVRMKNPIDLANERNNLLKEFNEVKGGK